MNIKLIEILKMSSLRSMLSDSEIDEVHEELSGDFNDFLEEETERITEEVKGTSMMILSRKLPMSSKSRRCA